MISHSRSSRPLKQIMRLFTRTKRHNQLSRDENTHSREKDGPPDTLIIDGKEITLRKHSWMSTLFLALPPQPLPSKRPVSPEDDCNFLTLLTFGYIYHLMRVGYDRIIEVSDMPKAPLKQQNGDRMKRLELAVDWLQQRGYTNYVEIFALAYAIKGYLSVIMIAKLFMFGSLYGNNVLMRALITEVSSIYYGDTRLYGRAVGMSIGLILLNAVSLVSILWSQYLGMVVGQVTKAMLVALSYDKMFRLSPRSRLKFSAATILTLSSNDTSRISMAFNYSGVLLSLPMALAGLLAVLIYMLGVSALVGLGLIASMLAANIGLSITASIFRKKSLPFADKRIAITRETLANMRIIKFYGWEKPFTDLISKIRGEESVWLKRLGFIQAVNTALLSIAPTAAGALSFTVRIVIGKRLAPELAFPSLTLFDIFMPIGSALAASISTIADAWNSAKRFDEYLRAEESPSYVQLSTSNIGIRIAGGSFSWEAGSDNTDGETDKHIKDTDTRTPDVSKIDDGNIRAGARKFPGLHMVNIDINRGELVMVVGSIGSGKTTLLSILTGMVPKISGTVEVGGVVAPVLSNWNLNATVRANIIFGKKFDLSWYNKVIEVCALRNDIAGFENQDQTEIGERGISLSGGQRARLALARCVYANAELIVLDDVLSAVDPAVSSHIFNNCILDLLANKTRIMSTHNLSLLERADKVVFLDGSGKVECGSLRYLLDSSSEFSEMYKNFHSVEHLTDKSDISNKAGFESEPSENQYRDIIHEISRNAQLEATCSDMKSITALSSRSDDGEVVKTCSGAKDENALISSKIEERERGAVRASVLLEYFTDGSFTLTAFCVTALVFGVTFAGSSSMESVFLNWWTGDYFNMSQGFYIGIYYLIICLSSLLLIVTMTIVCYFCTISSSRLHDKAIRGVYGSPMSYLDVTPLGRIVNRFTNDLTQLDTDLFIYLRQFLITSLASVGGLVVCFVYVPWSAIVLLPILVVVYGLVSFYRASAREMKRISSIFRSTVFTTLSETISGAGVLDAYGRVSDFKSILDDEIDDMNHSSNLYESALNWLCMRIYLAAQMLTFVTLMLAVFQIFKLSASDTGMLISILSSIAETLCSALPIYMLVESEMNSVERLFEYAHDIPQEAPSHIAGSEPASNWPQTGRIDFQRASLRYRDELPLVMRDLSFTIEGGQKIGICGRTGAGKSTLLSALFRITELYEGEISIDGVDISKLGLGDLRSVLSIIPQEPVLFQGTIRSNLDPFGQRTDVELWEALRRSGVIRAGEFDDGGYVSSEHKFHLDMNVTDEGMNFSLGERQLLTLARALVRQSQIIVLDEATAAVDFQSDQMIQKTIATEFRNRTILCIAHRLKTIIGYDKILVMEKGCLKEFATPLELFNTPGSQFASMCLESNITEQDILDAASARLVL